MDLNPSDALALYPLIFRTAKVVPLGNRGGFSGARIWQVETSGYRFCLRAWPPQQIEAARVEFLHSLMRQARSSGLSFVPALIATTEGSHHVTQAGRLWDLAEWLPGQADFHSRPSSARLEAAAGGLAHVHLAWEKMGRIEPDVCPALRRRLAAAAEWNRLLGSGWQPRWSDRSADLVRPIAEQAWQLLGRCVTTIPARLQRWGARPWSLRPCLCDVWHDHLLFEGDRLTGLVDYGAAKIDHPAVDIARMFGSLVPDDYAAWQVGLSAYRAVRPFSEEEAELAQALDRSGVVMGAATWLRWLYEEFRPFEDLAAVARRLSVLVGRMERWERG